MECYVIGGLVLCAFIGAMIVESKGRNPGIGLILGLLFGPIGLIIAAIISPNQEELDRRNAKEGKLKRCPDCAEMVQAEAKICRFCGHSFLSAPDTAPE